MKNDSSLSLGTGGDNSVTGQGEFFEGAIGGVLPVGRGPVKRTSTAAWTHS